MDAIAHELHILNKKLDAFLALAEELSNIRYILNNWQNAYAKYIEAKDLPFPPKNS